MVRFVSRQNEQETIYDLSANFSETPF